MRVALLPGCAQQVLAPEINEATIRLLTRHGCEVVVAPGSGCCGALLHHLGEEGPALALARANIDAWEKAAGDGGFDAIVANASGCGTMLKDYGFLLRDGPGLCRKAARIAGAGARHQRDRRGARAAGADRRGPGAAGRLSLGLLAAARPEASTASRRRCSPPPGSTVLDVPEGHLCCGSAGTYNLLQPEIADGIARPQARQYRADPPRSGRRRQYRLHNAARGAARRCRWCTRSSCSIGRPAARRRRGLGGLILSAPIGLLSGQSLN